MEQLAKLRSKIGGKAPKIFYDKVTRLFNENSAKYETVNIDIGDLIYEYIITPIRENGYANLYGRDITEKKKAEEEINKYSKNLEIMVEERTRKLKEAQEELIRKEKLAVLGQLAGGVSHELRNPLAALKNASYFLNMAIKKPEPDIKKTLDILNKEILRSEEIISSILGFARPRTPTKRKVNIGNIIQDIITQTNIPENIEVFASLDKSIPLVLTDPVQITQVFSNIILNAIHAMPEGGKLTVKYAITDKELLEISVTDTGIGIPEENIDKIFEPLYTTKAKGIGLGLALAKILIDANGGKVNVKSKIGEGTTFTIILQLKTVK